MRAIFISKRWLFLLWIFLGILLFILFAAKSNEDAYMETFASPASGRIIVIDPGHGGIDPGAVSPSGTREDILNLKVSLKLREYLIHHGAKVIMTRDTNDGLSLRKSEDMQKRVALIRESEPDLVVSIHMNKFTQSQYYGAQTFYMSGSEKGERLATCIQQQLLDNLNNGNKREIKAVNNLLILRSGSAPAVIVECGFLSNPAEEKLLRQEDYQDKIAWSIYSGIIEYFAKE